MSIILPEEIVEHIISFTCDRRGYNAYHYNIRKRLNWYRMDRILKEIKYFKQLDVSVGWLKTTGITQNSHIKSFKISLKKGKPAITYHTGCYRNAYHEHYINKTKSIELRRIIRNFAVDRDIMIFDR